MPQTHPKGAFSEVGHWIKKHPLASAVIGVVLGVIIYLVVTNSQAQTGSANGNTAPGNYIPDINIYTSPVASGGTPPSNPGGGTSPPVMPPTKPPGTKPPKRKGHPIIKKGKTVVAKGTTHTTVHKPKPHGHTPIMPPHALGHGPAHMPPTPKGPPSKLKGIHG